MKKIVLLVLVSGFCLSLQAQQPSHYSLYMLNKLNWNPAYAGLDHSLSMTGVFRKQWVGLEGSPTTQNVNIHMPLYITRGGIGLNLENDELGATRFTSAILAYNYQMDVGAGILSIGIGGGIMQRTLDGSILQTPGGIYSPDAPDIVDHQDDVLPIARETASVPTFQAGIYYQSEKFEAGLSIKNLEEASTDFSTVSLKLTRTYFFNAGFNFDLSSSISLHPSTFVRSDLAQTQIDFSTIVKYNGNIFGGASLRGYTSNNLDAVAIIAGFKLSENITVAYAYDLTLSDLSAVSSGSHEITINYNLNKRIWPGRPPRIIYNPRNL